MNAQELRIGNYVQLYRKPTDDEMSHGTIDQIIRDIDDFWFIHLNDGFQVNVKNGVRPIPLTEEWLRSFRFKHYEKDISGNPDKELLVTRWVHKFFIDGLEWWFEFEVDQQNLGNFFWLNWNHGGANHFVHLPKKLEYVHELQNLYFALTGEELQMKEQCNYANS